MLEEDLVLTLNTPVLDRAEFYFIQNNQIIRRSVVGDTIPLAELDYPYRIPVVPFHLNAQEVETRIFMRATSAVGVEIPLTLTTLGQFTAEQQSTMPFLGGLLSLFTLCFLFSGILYCFMRDTPFLAYTMFFGVAVIFFLTQTGLGRIWIWGENGEANSRISMLSGCLLLASFCLIG